MATIEKTVCQTVNRDEYLEKINNLKETQVFDFVESVLIYSFI